MTLLGLFVYFLFFSAAEAVNFFLSPTFFVFDIQIPVTIFFAFYFSGYRLYFSAVFFGLLTSATQGNTISFVLFSLGLAHILHISKTYFLISSLRFITVFTFIAALTKTVLFYYIVYRGRFIPKFLLPQMLFYVAGNALLSSVFYEAFSKTFCKMKTVYEKTIRNP